MFPSAGTVESRDQNESASNAESGSGDMDSSVEEELQVPTSLDEVLVQAQTDFAAATALGTKRLRLDILVPGLNEQVASRIVLCNPYFPSLTAKPLAALHSINCQIESRFPFDASMLVEVTLRLAAAIAPLQVNHSQSSLIP